MAKIYFYSMLQGRSYCHSGSFLALFIQKKNKEEKKENVLFARYSMDDLYLIR